MQTTEKIKKELTHIEAELERIDKILNYDDSIMNTQFIMQSGKNHPGWTFHDAITSYVAKKLLLQWVLSNN